MLIDESKYYWAAWEQPVMKSDTDWGMVSATSINVSGGRQPYMALDGDIATYWENVARVVPADFVWEFAKPLRISKIVLTNKYSGSKYLSKTVRLYAEKEKTTLLKSAVFEAKSRSVVTFEFAAPVCLDMLVLEFPDTYSAQVGLSEIAITAEVENGEVAPETKFLIMSDSVLYTLVDGTLSALAEQQVSSTLFRTHGCDEKPASEILLPLKDPKVLCWDSLTARSVSCTMQAVPYPQTVETPDYDMTHASIFGIQSVTVDAGSGVRFAVSFDSGQTWWEHNGSEWVESSEGMTALEVNAVGAEAWNSAATTGKYRFRAVIPDKDNYVKSLVVNYINE